jgi:DNA-binding transcriptional ArsR family regulator
MHLVPAERQNRRILDDHRVCEAISGIRDPVAIARWADRFSLVADPTRLTLLLCIAHGGPISVTDLAVAADMNDTTVSHALQLLRAAGAVAAHRDGRIIRYSLAEPEIARLLEHVSPLPGRGRTTAH